MNGKHIVILGAGFAGLELATRLSESLADDVRVTLIDQSEAFSFGYSKPQLAAEKEAFGATRRERWFGLRA